MQNPNKKYIPSNGADLPIMYVYLAGRIAGNVLSSCEKWRKTITAHYANYKDKGLYPISFLDPLNSGERNIDKLGLTSSIPPNLIYDKDLLSVKRADIIVANMDDYMEEPIQGLLHPLEILPMRSTIDLQLDYNKLVDAILNRRPNWGTDCEVAWALYLQKPLILIAGRPILKGMVEKHPFMKRASVIVKDVDQLIEEKWLNTLYKSISGATY